MHPCRDEHKLHSLSRVRGNGRGLRVAHSIPFSLSAVHENRQISTDCECGVRSSYFEPVSIPPERPPVRSTSVGVSATKAMRVNPSVDVAFAFGPFRLIPSQQVLVRENRPLKLGGRALDILHLLLMRAGEEISKNDLIEFAWPNVFVDEHNSEGPHQQLAPGPRRYSSPSNLHRDGSGTRIPVRGTRPDGTHRN